MNLVACVTSSALPPISATVGVGHDGISSRSVRQTGSPSLARKAAMNEPFWMSHCTITRSFQRIGELATPHS